MTKKENYQKELNEYLKVYFKTNENREILKYLELNSDLPSRRANIELANAFADLTDNYNGIELENIWTLCQALIQLNSNKAPTNNPKEFLPFCGIWAIGAIGANNQSFYQESLSILKEFANDQRWRVREAVAFGLQKLLKKHHSKVLKKLENWILQDNWLVMRAVAAGIAHPSVLTNKQVSSKALEIHHKIFLNINDSRDITSKNFKILKKGLNYTLSVVIQSSPKDGFAFFERYTSIENKQLQDIIKENLNKNRLIKNFPKEVKLVRRKLKY